MSKPIRITLKRSIIGKPEKHRRVVRSLGLRKLNRSVVVQDTPAIRGMIRKVGHLLEVEENVYET
ncbi:MAG: 50S ribosomal protein L30 [Desulfobacterales bacterium]|nr:50S ribosomal protein L30 [Desulfobacterales bacterium]